MYEYEFKGDINGRIMIPTPIGEVNLLPSLRKKFISVADFGAVGDGVTDDTKAFQNAINSKFNVVCEKNKTYIVEGLIIDRSNFILDGNNSTLKTKLSTSSCIYISSNSENIKIENLNFIGLADGTNDTVAGINIQPSGLDAVRGSSAENIEITHCNFLGGFVFSIIANSVTGLKIHDCYGTGNKYISTASAGGYFILTQSCYDVDIYNNKAVATETDRHAIYISCNNSLTTDQGNENVNIHHNVIDWTLANAGTGLECVIAIRTTRNINIHDNIITGGFGGILLNPSHGDMLNVDIHDNKVLQVKSNGVNDLYCIGFILQDKGGNFKVREASIHDNLVSGVGRTVNGFSFYDVIGFEFFNNKAIVKNTGSIGCQIGKSSKGFVGNNSFEGQSTARSGFRFVDTIDDVIFGYNKIKNFIHFNEEIMVSSVLTNIKYTYTRKCFINSNGLGSITITDHDNIVVSVQGDVQGCKIIFDKNVVVHQGLVSVINFDASPLRYFYNRSINISENSLILGVKSLDDTLLYNLSTHSARFMILINDK